MSSIHKISVEEIREQCQPLSNEELLLIVHNKRLYTEKIMLVAGQELRKRGGLLFSNKIGKTDLFFKGGMKRPF